MKKSYTNRITVLPRNPCRYRLMHRLGFPGYKMPADFTFSGVLPLEDSRGAHLGDFGIVVTVSKPTGRTRTRWNGRKGASETYAVKSSAHRVFARLGSRLIPVGRLAQAKL